MSNNSGVYFLTGLATGVAVAVLFAPHTGVETRDLIGRKAEEGKEALKGQGLKLKSQAMEMKNRANDLVDKSKQTLKEEKERLAYAIDTGVSAYKTGPAMPTSLHG
jgi:gas vesicle protein